MEDIIFNVVLTGVLLAVLCVVVMTCPAIERAPKKLTITAVFMFLFGMSVSIFGTITFIWIR